MTDWIIGHDATQGEMAYAFECKRCGAVQKVALPIAIPRWAAMAKAFITLHKGCTKCAAT